MIKHNIAIIAAAGNGSRMSFENSSKQFIELKNHPVIYYSVKIFSDCDFIDKIIITVKEEHKKAFMDFLEKYKFSKEILIINGGKTRQESVFNALESCKNEDYDYVFIHDGARPFLTFEMLEKGFSKMISSNIHCGAFGVKIKDTIKKSNSNNIISQTIDRNNLYSIQTPQIFPFKKYLEYKKVIKEKKLDFTDDCQIFEYFNHKIMILDGSYDNIKITTDDDIIIGESILKRRKK